MPEDSLTSNDKNISDGGPQNKLPFITRTTLKVACRLTLVLNKTFKLLNNYALLLTLIICVETNWLCAVDLRIEKAHNKTH